MSINNQEQNGQEKRGYLASQTQVEVGAAVLFHLGQVCMTQGARDALAECGESAERLLQRHQSGDWGQVCAEDKAENELSVKEGYRIMSVFYTRGGEKLFVITECDRSQTTLLKAEE